MQNKELTTVSVYMGRIDRSRNPKPSAPVATYCRVEVSSRHPAFAALLRGDVYAWHYDARNIPGPAECFGASVIATTQLEVTRTLRNPQRLKPRI